MPIPKGSIIPGRIFKNSPTRICSVCGRVFRIPLTANGRYSRRATCGRYCWRITISTAAEDLHERLRTQEPERYAKMQARDFSAMGRLGGAASTGKTGYKEPAAVTKYRIARTMEGKKNV